ncbi:MAG: hypothetical protein NT031_13100, partial [Planctomycetota bacterium]|nr:hypothetical protein [Planctomycetota bacterium]
YSGLLFRRGVVYSSAYPAGQQVFRINYDVAYKGFFATMRMRTPSGKWCVMARQTLDLGETWSYQAVGAMTDYGDGTYMLEYSLTGDPTAFTEPFHFTVPGTSDPIVAPTQKPAVDTPAPGAVNVALALSPAWDAITDTHVNEIGVTVLDMTAKTQAYQRILTDAARTSTGPVHLPANHACTLQLEFADAYHTTNENDIPFTVEKFIETDVSFTTAAGETGPDLTALAGDIALPEAAIPGDKGQVAVLLSNSGDAAAAGKTAVKLYASADNLLDPTDLLLGALPAQAVALAALGQPRSSLALRVPIVVPGALQPGRYRVLVKLEPASAAVDAHVNNNTSASNDTFDVTWKFGAFDAQHAAAKLHVTYGGKGVTLALTGGGYGDLLTGADGLSVALHGTTAASAATITPDKGMKAALAGITSDNGLKSITGKDVSLTGDATIGGALTAFTLADVTSSLITIGAPGAGDTRTAATIALGRLDDSRIRSLTPLKSLSVVEWLDDGGAPDSAQAPWIATLNSTGRKADPKNALPASTGDFQADLLLTPRPQDTALKSTLGTATIAGDLWADSWDVTGSIAALKVGRWAHNRTVGGRLEVRATGSIASAVVGGASHLDLLAGMNDPVSTPAARGDFNSTTAAISAFTVAGWKLVLGETAPDWFTHSRVCAAVLGTVKIVNVDDAAGEGSHLCAYAKGGGEIKSVTVTTLPTTVTKTYPARPPAPFAVPGLELDIL